MGAAGFWWALVVGLTVGALGLLVLLKHIARTRIDAYPQ
jgi:Na+-driven multidrug efflux pump